MFESSVQQEREHPSGGAAGKRAASIAVAGAVAGAPAPAAAGPFTADFLSSLECLNLEVADRELIDRIRVLEDVKAAAAAAQARATAAFDASRKKQQTHARADGPGQGVAAQIGLARRDSPASGNRHLGLAKALVAEMPHTLNALTAGALSEWRATILVKETACLDVADRARVDEIMAADPRKFEGLGDKRLTAEAKKHASALDPGSVVRRAAKAHTERTVTCRPAPDTMTYVTGLLPVAHGVAVQAALTRAADSARASGDPRGKGQIMADTLVDRIINPNPASREGQCRHDHDRPDVDGRPDLHGRPDVHASTGRGGGAGRPVREPDIEVQLIITDRTLLAGGTEPAYLHGYGTVPATWARDLIRGPDTNSNHTTAGNDTSGGADRSRNTGRNSDPGDRHDRYDRRGGPAQEPEPDPEPSAADGGRVWVRRLYTAPGTGRIVGMDSAARIFPAGLRRLLINRDQTCRTPWCDAPIRHIDHITAHSHGGPTSEDNGQGLCERCNQAKETPGFKTETIPGPRHTVRLTTPTGHSYQSTAPPPPGTTTEQTTPSSSGGHVSRSSPDCTPEPPTRKSWRAERICPD